MLHRFLSTLAMALLCFCASPAVPVAHDRPTSETELKFDSAPLPSDAEFARAARTDAIRMLNLAAKRYKITKPEGEKDPIAGYTAIFHKRERIGGTLQPEEVIRISFREDPYAIQMLWDRGSRRQIEGTLFAAGQNGNAMLASHRFLGVLTVDPRGSNARSSARYTIEEFGFYYSTKRSIRVWSAEEARGTLAWKFVGTRCVEEAGGRECHVVRRHCAEDEIDAFAAGEASPRITDANRADAFRTITVYFDTRTWLQVGSELHRADGELVGSYFFRDVKLNPPFPEGTFTKAALKR